MAEPGFVCGFIGVGIDMAIKEMRRHINIVVGCRKELESLLSVLISFQDINSDMQMYGVALNSGQFMFSENLRPASVDKWLRKLDMLLQKAAEMAQQCMIPRYNMISRYRTSKNIASMISITTQLAKSLCHVQQFNREMAASSSFSSTLPLTERTMYVGELLVLGQDMAFARLEDLVPNASRIVGMGGSGKTLFVKVTILEGAPSESTRGRLYPECNGERRNAGRPIARRKSLLEAHDDGKSTSRHDSHVKVEEVVATLPSVDKYGAYILWISTRLQGCQILNEEPADLHKVARLKQREIIECLNIEKLPQEFGENGAFPILEVFSLVRLLKLEELSTVEEAAMPSPKMFTVVQCQRLKRILENNWNWKSMEKIRVYGFSMAHKEMEENGTGKSKNVQTITMPTADTRSLMN